MRAPTFLDGWRLSDILLVAALLAGLIFAYLIYPNASRDATRSSFGPDWDCQHVPYSEPVCVKRVLKKTSP